MIARFCLLGGCAAGARGAFDCRIAAKGSPALFKGRLRRGAFGKATAFQILPERCMNGSSHSVENTQIFSLTLNLAKGLLSAPCWRDNPVETFAMFRAPIIAAPTIAFLAAALLGGTAMAQPANAPPANLSGSAQNAPDYDDEERPADRGYADAPPPAGAAGAYDNSQRNTAAAQQAQADRDIFCRRDAAARTGYTTPGDAARSEQTRGTVGGTLGGAALGAILGAAGGNAGLGAAAGAGAGLLAGTAIGADNARQAARSVEADYADAYYGCMHQDQRAASYDYGAPGYGAPGYGAPPPPAYAYGPPPPPPVYYYPAPAYYPYPYYGPSYGPSISFGFGFGGGHGWGGHRGFHGGGWGRHH
jgi:hypothetical protein